MKRKIRMKIQVNYQEMKGKTKDQGSQGNDKDSYLART